MFFYFDNKICFARSLNFTRSESGKSNSIKLNFNVFFTSRLTVSAPGCISATASHRIFSHSGEITETFLKLA